MEQPDWQNLTELMKNLRDNRVGVRQACTDEFEEIENSIHYVNKKLEGFAFKLTNHGGGGDFIALIRIDLIDLTEKMMFPWSYRATYHYQGVLDGYLAKDADGILECVEREKQQFGYRKYPDWEKLLGVLVYLNLRDTPRGTILV